MLIRNDTSATIARDLIADIGRTDALLYLVELLLASTSCRRSWAVLRLMWAVLIA